MRLLCFLFSMLALVAEVNFNHRANCIRDEKIEAFQILGERCSGTSYVSRLLKENLPGLIWNESMVTSPLQKHFIPWYLGKNRIDECPYNQFAKKNVLYIVVVRDALDWLRSFYRMPHHTNRSMRMRPFSQFIRSEWLPKRPDFLIKGFWGKLLNPLLIRSPLFKKIESQFWNQDPAIAMKEKTYPDQLSFWLDRQDPLTEEPFVNVMVLRNRKHQNYLKLKEVVNNVIYVKYETVAEHPEEFIEYVAGLTKASCSSYHAITNYKGCVPEPYVPKEYFEISSRDREFILSQLDQDLEKELGYIY